VRKVKVFREDRFESPSFVSIVQHYYGHHAQGLAASTAIRYLTLQILQKTIREMILRPLATGILLAPFAAVRTDELDPVLLRIAVQSRPTGAAHADNFRVLPFHWIRLL
jgi:hypothetical protein